MVRDPGWYMLDSGRGLEQALQVSALLRVTVCAERLPDIDRLVTEAVLTAAESIVTFRPYQLRARTEEPGRTTCLRSHQPALARLPADPRADGSAGHPQPHPPPGSCGCWTG